jgi:hypothetical protein
MEWNAAQLLQTSGSYWGTCALHAGVRLGVFTRIRDEGSTAQELAQDLATDERALTMLLNALAAMKLLIKSGGSFKNTPGARKHLSRESEAYIGHMIMHHHYLMESWTDLARAVQTGKPLRGRSSRTDPERREAFLMGMFNTAMNLAPLIVPGIDLAKRRHLLDLGGGPGTYAIALCQKYPTLQGTVFDLETTRPFAQKTIRKFDLADRIGFMPGDYLEDDLGGPYDAAWLSHILHAEGPKQCRAIIRKAVAALEPGGMIMIHDFFLNDTMDGPPFPALFALNMLLGTESGRSYSEAEVREMLAEAGVKKIRRLEITLPNDSGILVGST